MATQPNGTYTCIINEAQRKALAYALRQLPQSDLDRLAKEAPMDDDVFLLPVCTPMQPPTYHMDGVVCNWNLNH